MCNLNFQDFQSVEDVSSFHKATKLHFIRSISWPSLCSRLKEQSKHMITINDPKIDINYRYPTFLFEFENHYNKEVLEVALCSSNRDRFNTVYFVRGRGMFELLKDAFEEKYEDE